MVIPVTAPETALVRDLRGLVSQLFDLYGSDFMSLNLYGSAVDLEKPPRDGEVQLLVVLTNVSLPILEKAQLLLNGWWKSHRLAPLFLGRHEFDRSLDVFPLEFLHMKNRYVCLHGEDVLATMSFNKEHVRLQVEEDLKTKAFWLRQFYVHYGKDDSSLRETLIESCQGIARIYDGLLAIKDRQLPRSQDTALREVATLYNIDIAPLQALQTIAQTQAWPGRTQLIQLAYAYDRVLNSLIEIVDAMEPR